MTNQHFTIMVVHKKNIYIIELKHIWLKVKYISMGEVNNRVPSLLIPWRDTFILFSVCF